jgi:transposase
MAREKSPPPPKIVELNEAELRGILQRLPERGVNAEDCQKLSTLLDAYLYVLALVSGLKMSIKRLRTMLFGAKTETTAQVLATIDPPPSAPSSQESSSTEPTATEPTATEPTATEPTATEPTATEPTATEAAPKKPRPPGHGRNGVDQFPGADQIFVPHETLQAGDPCPACGQGTVYATPPPGVLIRFTGQPPIQATIFRLEKLRCHLCGAVFTAPSPPEAGSQKYDPTVASMIALLKYGSGLPFNRLRRLQGGLGVPLPAATQWLLVHAAYQDLQPVFDELIRLAAQGDFLHHDDTPMKILELMEKNARAKALAAAAHDTPPPAAKDRPESAEDSPSEDDPERTGIFTSGIVSMTPESHTIALFFTGRQHAGENLRDVLGERVAELERPIQMCDPLSRNMPAELNTILANCLAHGRRKFVEVADCFPAECRHVLEALKVVYQNDAQTRAEKLSPEARLEFHQTHSRPVMEELHRWLKRQLDDHLVEPNSGLGQSIKYLLRHWDKMTLFLRQAGAPLDNNVCERALKKAILHRKNSLFYKTQNGADVGDLFMSLIYTCELNGENPFDYLTELQRHASAAALDPSAWLPWTYRQTLASLSVPSATG